MLPYFSVVERILKKTNIDHRPGFEGFSSSEMVTVQKWLLREKSFIQSIKLSLITSSTSCSSQPRQFFYAKLKPVIRSRFAEIRWKSIARAMSFQNTNSSGSTTRIGSVLAMSAVFGAISFWPRISYAMDGLDILGPDDIELWHAPDVEENQHPLWKFAKKFWLPVFFFLTVLSHLDDPITIIAFKVILFLLSTKPSPFSVYVSVNEFCHRLMRQEPHLYYVKSLYAHKVEVQDFKLLCLARVEVKDQKFTLVGILGGWWALPRLSGPFSLFRLKDVMLRN